MKPMSIPARGKTSRERASLARRVPHPARPSAPGPPGGNCWTPPSAFSPRTVLKRARLEDIAAGAGYTRGAFYANFESKEDIFFALFEEWVRERIESLTDALRRHSDPAEKLVALRNHYAELAKDRRLVLISMEFKLFALRHPEAHARLRNRHRRIRASFGELFSEIMRALGKTLPIAYPAASACLGALAQGLLLEHLVDPKTLSDGDVRHVLGLFFDSHFFRLRRR